MVVCALNYYSRGLPSLLESDSQRYPVNDYDYSTGNGLKKSSAFQHTGNCSDPSSKDPASQPSRRQKSISRISCYGLPTSPTPTKIYPATPPNDPIKHVILKAACKCWNLDLANCSYPGPLQLSVSIGLPCTGLQW